MFDNTKPNIIILADYTDTLAMGKTLGPYKVAHVLREHGFQVAVIHHLSVFRKEEIFSMLSQMISDQTLFVGINNFFYQLINDLPPSTDGSITFTEIQPGAMLPHGVKYNKDLKKIIQDKNPKCKLMLGGPTAIDVPYNKDFDYVVMGYAEVSIVNLAKHLFDSSVALKKSHRSVYGPIVINDSKAESFDFSQSTMEYTDHDGILPGETLTLEVGRGCIFKCSFCSYPLNGKKKLDFIRHRDLIYKELIDNYNRFGVTRYQFVDDTVNDSVEKCQMIYEISKSLPFKLEWWGYIRLDLMTAHPETIDMLFESGLRCAFFGIETLNPKTASAVGKGGNRERLLCTIKYIKDRWGDSVSLHGAFVYGLPYETAETLEKTTNFLLSDENPLDSYQVKELHLRDKNGIEFLSDMDLNYKKYGYDLISDDVVANDPRYSYIKYPNYLMWKTDNFDFLSIVDQVKEIQRKAMLTRKNKVNGLYSFFIAGLGLPLETTLNKYTIDVPWHDVDMQKLKRALLYKHTVFKNFNIHCDITLQDELMKYKTFGEYLQDQQ
jgi:hypothetical protein